MCQGKHPENQESTIIDRLFLKKHLVDMACVDLCKISDRVKDRILFCKIMFVCLNGLEFLFLLFVSCLHVFQPLQQMEQGYYKLSH